MRLLYASFWAGFPVPNLPSPDPWTRELVSGRDSRGLRQRPRSGEAGRTRSPFDAASSPAKTWPRKAPGARAGPHPHRCRPGHPRRPQPGSPCPAPLPRAVRHREPPPGLLPGRRATEEHSGRPFGDLTLKRHGGRRALRTEGSGLWWTRRFKAARENDADSDSRTGIS